MTLQKIDELKEPPIVGEYYLVPCIVSNPYLGHTYGEWVKGQYKEFFLTESLKKEFIYYTPIINHPHSDKENGQVEIHYHRDYRFQLMFNSRRFPINWKIYKLNPESRPTLTDNKAISYIAMKFISQRQSMATSVGYIVKSKLCHHKIHKGKCPHRGADLSQVVPNEDGEIVCPLHSLRFDAITKKMIH